MIVLLSINNYTFTKMISASFHLSFLSMGTRASERYLVIPSLPRNLVLTLEINLLLNSEANPP